MWDCPLGTRYSNAAVPSASRKVILAGRSILEAHRENVLVNFLMFFGLAAAWTHLW